MLLNGKTQKRLGSGKLFKIYFTDEYDEEPMIISENLKAEIEQKVSEKKGFSVGEKFFNPFGFKKIVEYSEKGFDVNKTLSKEHVRVQTRVKYFMKYDKKNKLTETRLKAMIEKAKEDLQIF